MPDKIAFLFLTVGNLTQPKFWQRFFQNHNQYSIYLHSKHPEKLDPFFQPHTIESIPTKWGDISLVRATLLLLKEAVKDPDNCKFVLLSDSCVPIQPFDEVYRVLMNDDLGYIQNEGHACMKRRPENVSMSVFYKQSQWMVFNLEMARLALEHDMTDDFQEMFAPDEHYFITLYCVLGKMDLFHSRNLTHVNWAGNRNHPFEYGKIWLPGIKLMQDKGLLFMRKVTVESDVMDKYRLIMGQFDPRVLVYEKRIDLVAGILYVLYGKKSEYFVNLYLEHKRAFNGLSDRASSKDGSWAGKKKRGKQDFIDAFDKLIESVIEEGNTLPVDVIEYQGEYWVRDGMHRVSTIIAQDLDLNCRIIHRKWMDWYYPTDIWFFQKRGLKSHYLDTMMRYYLQEYTNFFIFAQYSKHPIDWSKYPSLKIVYQKEIKTNKTFWKNLVLFKYYPEKWFNKKNQKWKAKQCAKENKLILYCVVDQEPGLSNRIKLKETYRQSVKRDKHSCHCTDTKQEAQLMLSLFHDPTVESLKQQKIPIKKLQQFEKDDRYCIVDLDNGLVVCEDKLIDKFSDYCVNNQYPDYLDIIYNPLKHVFWYGYKVQMTID